STTKGKSRYCSPGLHPERCYARRRGVSRICYPSDREDFVSSSHIAGGVAHYGSVLGYGVRNDNGEGTRLLRAGHPDVQGYPVCREHVRAKPVHVAGKTPAMGWYSQLHVLRASFSARIPRRMEERRGVVHVRVG